ncbi:CorA family divalent cation transporter [Ruoffia sp. FAM 26254]|uniref:CorA family divalent cation transporter n=1 Tax=unclassified Ruoffia TaxID=2862149 RepID=UPI000EBFA11C|nr:hypothetical protein [Aerococcaceae bacterium]
MVQTFKLDDSEQAKFLIFHSDSHQDEQDYVNQFNLPNDVFALDDISAVAPRFEEIPQQDADNSLIVVLSNVTSRNNDVPVEDRLETLTFILQDNTLLLFLKEGSTFDRNLLHQYMDKFDSIASILVYARILMYSNLHDELQQQKAAIDDLNNKAKNSTSGDVLRKVADTERNLVILEHTIETLDETVSELLATETFTNKLDNSALEYDLKWYNRQVIKLVHVYRDLLDSVSSLFSDLVSDNLNKLMKFLNSLSLVLASASLISEFWGINAGGLPGENSDYGTLGVLILVVISTASMAIFLKKKDYF